MMQNEPLNLIQVLQHAAEFHGNVPIVTRRVEDGSIHRYTYADAMKRTCQLAHGLKNLGVQHGDRVGTMAWNTYRHLEAWYAIAGQGAICHTINPRLFDGQIEFIVRHAEDKILMIDPPLLPILERLIDRMPSVEHVIVMTDEDHMPCTTLTDSKSTGEARVNLLCMESLMAHQSDEFPWPMFPEDSVSSLCYTSGTTGDPKGVAYTHRSNFLHAYAAVGKDALGVARGDVMLMVVPMFHANSWGLAYSCPMVGAEMVLPGSQLDGASVYELLDARKVTITAGVPTVWNMLLDHLRAHDLRLPHLNEIVVGGAAVPRHMVESFQQDYGVQIVHAWGMTEMSPMGTVCRLKPPMRDRSQEEQMQTLLKQGAPIFGVSMKIVDDDGNALPHDGETFGRLLVKGPWIVKRYYKADTDCVDDDGWFDTGDIATIDPDGFMQITDRAKDLIKSGGEWISSVDLENAAANHPQVDIAAAIGIPHPKWGERPMLVIKPVDGADLTADKLNQYLAGRVAKWWLPDAIEFVDEIPLTATGKISKRQLRQKFLH